MLICAPLKKKTASSLISSLKKAQEITDIVEIWFDEVKSLSDEEIKKILSIKQKPVIYKCQNLENIELVLNNKIEFIDLDIKTPSKIIKQIKKKYPKTKIIISYHNFKETPTLKTLKDTAKKIKSKGSDIIKIATHAKTFEDSIRILSFLSELNSKKEKAICLCMGEKGEITRTAGHILGNYLMYAPIKDSDASAPGQLTVKQLQWHLK